MPRVRIFTDEPKIVFHSKTHLGMWQLCETQMLLSLKFSWDTGMPVTPVFSVTSPTAVGELGSPGRVCLSRPAALPCPLPQQLALSSTSCAPKLTGLLGKGVSPGRFVLFELMWWFIPKACLIFNNANTCLSDYAFPFIILVLSLVTLAVYMSASEIEVRSLSFFINVVLFFCTFDGWLAHVLTSSCSVSCWLIAGT